MASEPAVLKGVVRGRTVELEREAGLPDGQSVQVVLLPVGEGTPLAPGEGIRRSAGGWAEEST